MPGPSCTLSRSVILVSHLCETEPGQPGMTRRSGAPWMFSSGLPFMAHTSRHCTGPSPCADGTPRDRVTMLGVAGEVRVGTVVGGVDGRRLDAGGPEHVGKRHAGPFGTAHAAIGPLVATRLRSEIRATVAAALQHHAIGLGLEALLEIAQSDFERLVDLAVDGELPGVRLAGRLGQLPVVADEEFGRGRRVVVEQLLGRLGHQRLVAEHDQVRRPCRGSSASADPSSVRAPGHPSWPPAPTPPGSTRPAWWRRTRSARRPRRSWRQAQPRRGSRAETCPSCGRTPTRRRARDRRHRSHRSAFPFCPFGSLPSERKCCGATKHLSSAQTRSCSPSGKTNLQTRQKKIPPWSSRRAQLASKCGWARYFHGFTNRYFFSYYGRRMASVSIFF